MFLDRIRFLPNYGVDMHVVKVIKLPFKISNILIIRNKCYIFLNLGKG